MNRFTILPEFIQGCMSTMIFFDVLSRFPNSNSPFQVCLDNRELAFHRYEEIARDNEIILFWIKALNKKSGCFFIVNIETTEFESDIDLFLAIANNVLPSKQIITSDKKLFYDKMKFITDNTITLLDPKEAALRLNQTVFQISYGNNSPNINGNNNSIL